MPTSARAKASSKNSQSSLNSHLNSQKFFIGAVSVLVIAICARILVSQFSSIYWHEIAKFDPPMVIDFGNRTYRIDDQRLTFSRGDQKHPDNEPKRKVINTVVSSTGENAAAVLVVDPGGSGEFYYLTAAQVKANQQSKHGYKKKPQRTIQYTQPILLGDRVKIEHLTINNAGQIQLKYKTHSADSPMAEEPDLTLEEKYKQVNDVLVKE